MRTWLLYVIMCCPLPGLANNLVIEQVAYGGGNQLSLTISWENSWDFDFRSASPNNHDAVWTFVKVMKSDRQWHHADVSVDTSLHTAGNPLVVLPASDGKGVFIRRTDEQVGDITSSTITLQLQQPIPTDAYAIKVFGVEMVWIQGSAFFVGDSASNYRLGTGDDFSPYLVGSEDAIAVGNGPTQLSDTFGLYPPEGTIPAVYPKGYDGFYCMKYEISQEQYKDFLNTLTYQQQQERTAVSPGAAAGTLALSAGNANRNGIKIGTPGSAGSPAIYVCDADATDAPNEVADGQTRACNYLSWADVAAYLDWAALRPMTELEFEKAARGFEAPVALEFAWGTPEVVDANNIIGDGGPWETATDVVTGNQGLASHGYNGPQGPVRCGFAADSLSDRRGSGSGYFGCMELSGNLWEMVVNTTTAGLQFTGTLGDGNLTIDGEADVSLWPANDGNGAGFRGGGWNSGIIGEFRDLAVSDRFYIYQAPVNRRNTSGGRGVR